MSMGTGSIQGSVPVVVHSEESEEAMIAIIDYDAGNIKSVEKALQYLGQDTMLTRDPEMIRKLADTTPYSKSAAGAPVVIVPCYRTNGLWAPMYDTIDLSIATENMLLEITSLGLGAVWMGIAPIEDRILAVDRILGLGEDLHSFALVPVGYPAESRPQQDRFQEERIHWIG